MDVTTSIQPCPGSPFPAALMSPWQLPVRLQNTSAVAQPLDKGSEHRLATLLKNPTIVENLMFLLTTKSSRCQLARG